MPETILQNFLTGALDVSLLLRWLRREPLKDVGEDCVLFRCNRIEFAEHFVSYLRTQIDSILQSNTHIPATAATPPACRPHRRSTSDPTAAATAGGTGGTAGGSGTRHGSQGDEPRERRRVGRRVKAKLFTDHDKSKESMSMSSDDSRLSVNTTPSPVSASRSHSRSDRRRPAHSRTDRACLGDYISCAKDKERDKDKKKRKSKNEESERDLDISNSDVFPTIGEHKSSQKPRRIKPTTVAPTNSAPAFGAPGSGTVLQSPAWGPSAEQATPSPCIDRSMLKLQRQLIQDKFSSPVTSTPLVKVTREEPTEFISADVNKVTNKDKLDTIVMVYDYILENNLTLNVTAELYRLIYVLVSKQCVNSEPSENSESDEENIIQSIHNTTYVAVKCVWLNRHHIQLLLDDGALKQLGDSRSVRSYSPDLAKYLLNEYGLRSERREERQEERECEEGGVVCFNMETDNVDNFPSVLSFQNFKKQRDMYYEIYRWWCGAYTGGASRASLRARVKALLSVGAPSSSAGASSSFTGGGGGGGTGTSTLPHLAALVTSHMLGECASDQETRLSKLQRRLAGEERASSWKELFYRELLLSVDSASLRAHACDALSAALQRCTLAATSRHAGCWRLGAALARLLGALLAAPYTAATRRAGEPMASAIKGGKPRFARLLDGIIIKPNETIIARFARSSLETQPCIDLEGLLTRAQQSRRLVAVVPALAQLLAAQDRATLRSPYYTRLLEHLTDIYRVYLTRTGGEAGGMDRDTRVLLVSALGSLFHSPQLPHTLLYSDTRDLANTSRVEQKVDPLGEEELEPLDGMPLADGKLIAELCGLKRHLRASTGGACGVARHVTPVSVSLQDGSDTAALQARLGAALLASLPGAWRRAAEHTAERVAAAGARDLPALLPPARRAARAAALSLVQQSSRGQLQRTAVVVQLSAMYSSHLSALHSAALQRCRPAVLRRSAAGVAALLPHAPAALQALTARHALVRLRRWVHDYWPTTAVLCKDIEAEARELMAQVAAGTCAPSSGTSSGAGCGPGEGAEARDTQEACLGAAEAIIFMKEQVCLVLSGSQCALQLRVPAQRVTPPSCARALAHLAVDLALAVAAKRPRDITPSFLQQLSALWTSCAPYGPRDTLSPPGDLAGTAVDHAGDEGGRRFGEELRAPTPPPSDDDDTTPVRLAPLPPVSPLSPSRLSPGRLSPRARSPSQLSPGPLSPGRRSPAAGGDSDDVFSRLLCPRNVAVLETGDDCPDACGPGWQAWGVVVGATAPAGALEASGAALYRRTWGPRATRGLAGALRAAGAHSPLLAFLADYCADMNIHERQHEHLSPE